MTQSYLSKRKLKDFFGLSISLFLLIVGGIFALAMVCAKSAADAAVKKTEYPSQ